MRFERLTTTDHGMYTEAMELYKASFPFHEQREAASQADIINNGDYQFNLIYDGNKFIGLILCWETVHFIYVEHFCVLPAERNKKYGQKALELLGRKGKPVILEIDPPIDELSTRRKAFYERVGYAANRYEHVHPAYHKDCPGHPLIVMSYPEGISKDQYSEFAQYLKTVVMGS